MRLVKRRGFCLGTGETVHSRPVWGRPVHLDTQLDGEPIRLTHDGTEAKRTKDEPEDAE